MKSRLIKFILTAISVLLIISIFIFYGDYKAESETLFYTYDSHGNLLNGYFSEKDNTWYLFVTSTESLPDTELYCKETITSSSAGEIDTEKNVIKDVFNSSENSVNVKTETGSEYKVTIMQSSLPSVYIDLADTTLNEIHADKDKVHYGNSISIYDPDDKYDLSILGALEIKGRGNSTWEYYEKKAYQIKFNEAISVMGMGEAKSWILLANSSDDSMMRNQLVYEMAKSMDMAFVPTFRYVDLWVEGEYRGTFLLGEKDEVDNNRLKLNNSYGAMFEHDEAFYEAEEYWFYNEKLQRHFVLKDMNTVKPSLAEAAINDFNIAIDELITYLYSTPPSKVTLNELSKMIDVDSFVKYYLINEYTQNRESFATSFYWYKDGTDDVIHLGPIWDFDTCMGNDGASSSDSYGSEHIIFRYLLASDEFYNRTLQLYDEYKQELYSMTDNTEIIKENIESSAKMNYIRWDVLGMSAPKDGGVDFCSTFDEAVSAVKNWLEEREEAFKIEKSNVVTSVVSDGCYEMEINFESDADYRFVKFAVWSLDGGQDDIAWYDAYRAENSLWTFTIDLADHNSKGIYRIVVYTDDLENLIASGYNYVETVCERRYTLSTNVSEDCKFMEITFNDSGLCSDMQFAVWSYEGAQDDLEWYTAERIDETTWYYKVDLENHKTAGIYYIHAYTSNGNEKKFVDNTTADVEFIAN